MEHDPKQLQALLQQAVPPDVPVVFRPMFGGILGYADGKPFASLSNAGLALKMTGEHHTALLAVSGAVALRYAADQPQSKTYVVVPDAMLADRDALRGWIGRSILNLPRAKPRSPRRKM